jgi:hypothetical protein
MWARIAAFEGGDIDRLRQMAEERQAAGSSGMPQGVRRMAVLVDRDGGRRLFVTYFDSREAIEAAEQRFEAMGDEIPDEVRGRRTSVDVYEVAYDESA